MQDYSLVFSDGSICDYANGKTGISWLCEAQKRQYISNKKGTQYKWARKTEEASQAT